MPQRRRGASNGLLWRRQHKNLAVAVAVAVAMAVAVAVRSLALAKAKEDPKGGAQGCAPFFIGTGMSRMKNPRGCTARAGL
jgi:hypothetical protein